MRKIVYNKEFKAKNKNENKIYISPNKYAKPLKINTLNINKNIPNIKFYTERYKTLRENNIEEFPTISTVSNKLKKKKKFIKPLALTNTPSLVDFYESNEYSHKKINKSNLEYISLNNRFRNLKLKDNIKTYLFTSLNRPKLLQSTLKQDSENAFYNSTESNIKKYSSKKLISPFDNKKINLNNNVYKIKRKYTRRISFVRPISKKYLKKSSSFSSFDRMLEELDHVPLKNQKINYINKLIKKSLRNDINSSPWEEEDYIFYDKIENRINFFFDRILLPQLNNQLYFKNKIYDNFNELNEALIKSNFISKEIQMSLNRQRVKLILKSNELYKKLKMKRILRGYEKTGYDDENLSDKFELEDFFIKKYTYNDVKIATEKERNSILKKCQRYSMTFYNIDIEKIKKLNKNIEIKI